MRVVKRLFGAFIALMILLAWMGRDNHRVKRTAAPPTTLLPAPVRPAVAQAPPDWSRLPKDKPLSVEPLTVPITAADVQQAVAQQQADANQRAAEAAPVTGVYAGGFGGYGRHEATHGDRHPRGFDARRNHHARGR